MTVATPRSNRSDETVPRSTGRTIRLWPGLVFVLLGLNISIVCVTIYAAHIRPASFAVESEYDRKALNWDETVRQRRHDADLGWTVGIVSTADGKLQVALSDKQNRPIDGASVEVEAFHHARAGAKVVVTCSASLAGSGQYIASMPIETPGLWEFRFTVKCGAEVYTHATTRLIEQTEMGHHQ